MFASSMTFTPSDPGFVSTANTNTSLAGTAYAFHTGTAQAGSVNTITLASSGPSATDDAYNNFVVEIVSGTGKDQARLISDYVGATKVATVSTNWSITPDSTSVYTVHYHSGVAQSGSSDSITLSSASNPEEGAVAVATDDYYNKCFIKLVGGKGRGQVRRIVDYVGSTKVVSIDVDWDVQPDSTTLYAVYGEGGTATAGGASTITLDGNQRVDTTARVANLIVEIHTGTGAGQVRTASSISGNVLTVGSAWDTQPDTDSEYIIYGGWAGTYEDVHEYAQITCVFAINTSAGERGIASMDLGITSTGTILRQKYSQVISGQSSVHSFTVVTEYFRVRIISTGTANTGAVQTIHHKNKGKHLTTFADETVTVNNDTEVTRAIINAQDATGAFRNLTATADRRLNINLPYTAFGEMLTATQTPFIQIGHQYGISPLTDSFAIGGSATITNSASLTSVSTGTTTGNKAMNVTKDVITYRQGQGIDARFTAVFTNPVAGTTQIIGIGDAEDGLFVGYNGLDFGVMRRYGGSIAIYSLTITAAASATGNLTITLNGEAQTVAVTSGDSIAVVAKKIEQTDFSSTGGGWRVNYDADHVHFSALIAETRAGSYSFAAGGTGVTATGPTQEVSGSAPTETWVNQSDWNLDRADNTSALPVLDTSKGNVFRITFQWLGYGMQEFSMEEPTQGIFVPVHRFAYANANTAVSMKNPTLPMMMFVDNGATTSDIVLKTASMGAIMQGNLARLGLRNGISATQSIGTTETVLLAVWSTPVYNSVHNKVVVQLTGFTLGSDSTKSSTFVIYRNAGIDGTPVSQAVPASSTTMQYTSTTGMTIDSNYPGEVVGTYLVGATAALVGDFAIGNEIILNQNDILIVTGRVNSGSASDLSAGFSWLEIL